MDTRAATASLNRIAIQLSNTYNFGVFTSPPLRPAEIINYRSMGTTPAILGSALAVGAVVALGLTLVASVRRRRRDLALLKTLGSTRRQLASVVAWQSSIAVLIGTVVGVPLGIVAGRVLWTLFANEIHAVPSTERPRTDRRPRRAGRPGAGQCGGGRARDGSRRAPPRPFSCEPSEMSPATSSPPTCGEVRPCLAPGRTMPA